MLLGNRLRELRKKHHKTQAELGKLLGTDQSGYSKYENGVHSLPISLLGILANYYHISIDELLGFQPGSILTEEEKALEKLDEYGINYIKDDADRISLTYAEGCSGYLSLEELPEVIQSIEQECEGSLTVIKSKLFRAGLMERLHCDI